MEDRRRLDDSDTRYAIAAGVTLLVAVLLGVLLGLLGDRVHRNGIYLPLLMPALMGWLIGAYSGRTAGKLGLPQRLPMILCAVFGATLAYAAYQIMGYMGVTDVLIAQLPQPMNGVVADPAASVGRFMEHQTGEHGVWAYLAFILDDGDPRVSPWGLLASMKPGLGATIALMAVEWIACAGVAGLIGLQRSGLWGREADATTRHTITGTDDDGLMTVMRMVEAGDMEGAARHLAVHPCPRSAVTHLICIEYADDSDAQWDLVFYESAGASGQLGTRRAQRTLSALLVQSFWDAYREALAAGEPEAGAGAEAESDAQDDSRGFP